MKVTPQKPQFNDFSSDFDCCFCAELVSFFLPAGVNNFQIKLIIKSELDFLQKFSLQYFYENEKKNFTKERMQF